MPRSEAGRGPRATIADWEATVGARCWRTTEPLEPGFERAWNESIARMPYAHFGFRLDLLAWQARHGVPGMAVLVQEAHLRGAIVARFERGAWVSGLPWRWQAAVEGPVRAPAAALGSDEAEVLFRHLGRCAGGKRVRCFLPCPPARGNSGYVAGKTLLHDLNRTDDELIRAMDKTKRSAIRRAGREGWRTIEPREIEWLRAFNRVQHETEKRHGQSLAPEPDPLPAPGERWREWELPWMWLLLAVRGEEVGSGFGFALGPGTLIESRAAASTAGALKEGAFVLLAYEAARRARERGMRWLNWGGDTFFKRDVTGPLGAPVTMHCWLGGGGRWKLANRTESAAWKLRTSAAAWVHRPRGAPRTAGARIVRWSTRDPLPPEFERDWNRRLARAPHAHFAIDLPFLAWEARSGRHSTAVLCDEGDRGGALVLRETRHGWVGGWPWRWQAVIEDPERRAAVGLSADEAGWLFEQARHVAGAGRLRCFLPHAAPAGVAAYAAGSTILLAIDRADEEILQSMDASKRRMVRRAAVAGYEVREANTLDEFRAFAQLQQADAERRDARPAPPDDALPAPGEGFREWELPWMWLLVAVHGGRVESGLGDGVRPGGIIEGRTAASSRAGRRAGAFALLSFEEARRGRERGHRWINLCGDTRFKREVAGRLGHRVQSYSWLGGEGRWALGNASEALWRNARARAVASLQALRPRERGQA